MKRQSKNGIKYLQIMQIFNPILGLSFHFVYGFLCCAMEKAMTPHSSTLAWKIPWTEEPGRLQSMGSLKSRTRLSDLTFTFHFPALEKEMATHSSVLAWRIPGTGEPDGLLSMGSNRVGHDWSDFAVVVVAVQKLISFNRSHLFTSAFISIALENYLRNHCYNFC